MSAYGNGAMTKQVGICHVCLKEVTLRGDGTISHHRTINHLMQRVICPGRWKTPASAADVADRIAARRRSLGEG